MDYFRSHQQQPNKETQIEAAQEGRKSQGENYGPANLGEDNCQLEQMPSQVSAEVGFEENSGQRKKGLKLDSGKMENYLDHVAAGVLKAKSRGFKGTKR